MAAIYQAKILLKTGYGNPGQTLDSGEAGFDLSTNLLYIGKGIGNMPIIIGEHNLDGLIPYIGASQDLNTGTHSITTESLKFNLNPSLGFINGQIYYNDVHKTITANLDDTISLQIGQENHVLIYNNSGGTLLNGKAVYITGTYGQYPTANYAIATKDASSHVIGICTRDISNGQVGRVTNLGVINEVNTGLWPAGTTLYLSTDIFGGLTDIIPLDPFYPITIGRVLVSDNSIGSILMNTQIGLNIRPLTSLSDVEIHNPIVDDILTYNGNRWVNSAGGIVSAGPTVNFYLDSSKSSLNSDFGINTIPLYEMNRDPKIKIPPTSIDVSIRAGTDINNYPCQLIGSYCGGPMNVSVIPAGEWIFTTFAAITNGGISGFTEIVIAINKAFYVPSVSLNVTGSGTIRNAAITGGSPFISNDYDPSTVMSTWVITPQGQYKIIGFNSATDVSIQTPSTYINDSSVSLKLSRALFTSSTGNLSSDTITQYKISSIQGAFSVNPSDNILARYFARTTVSLNQRVVSIYYNDTLKYTNFQTPLALKHNDLLGLQGGLSSERFHINSAELSSIQNLSMPGSNLTTDASGKLAVINSPSFIGDVSILSNIYINQKERFNNFSLPNASTGDLWWQFPRLFFKDGSANRDILQGSLKGNIYPISPSEGDMFYRTDIGLLFVYDGTRSKYLSASRSNITGGRSTAIIGSTVYTRVGDATQSSTAGYKMIRNGTITGFSADNNNILTSPRSIQLLINDVSALTRNIDTSHKGFYFDQVNVDFNAGDIIQVSALAGLIGSALNNWIIGIEFATRA